MSANNFKATLQYRKGLWAITNNGQVIPGKRGWPSAGLTGGDVDTTRSAMRLGSLGCGPARRFVIAAVAA